MQHIALAISVRASVIFWLSEEQRKENGRIEEYHPAQAEGLGPWDSGIILFLAVKQLSTIVFLACTTWNFA